MELKEPTTLLTSARDSGGLVVAVAKTTDGGSAAVRWDPEDKSWVFAKGLAVGAVLTAAPAAASLLMAEEVDTSNVDLSLLKA